MPDPDGHQLELDLDITLDADTAGKMRNIVASPAENLPKHGTRELGALLTRGKKFRAYFWSW